MADLISREAARNVINTWGCQRNKKIRMILLHTVLNAIPAVDAIPVEWLQKKREYTSEGDSLDVGIAEVLDMWEKEQEVR